MYLLCAIKCWFTCTTCIYKVFNTSASTCIWLPLLHNVSFAFSHSLEILKYLPLYLLLPQTTTSLVLFIHLKIMACHCNTFIFFPHGKQYNLYSTELALLVASLLRLVYGNKVLMKNGAKILFWRNSYHFNVMFSHVFFFIAEFDAQINTKLKEIERMKLEVSQLKLKRKRCDNEVERLHKRLLSCDNALKEIPGASTASNGMWLCSIWRCFQGLSRYLGCHAIQCCVTIVIVATGDYILLNTCIK